MVDRPVNRATFTSAADKSKGEAPKARAASSAATSEALIQAASVRLKAPSQRGGRVIFSSNCFRLSKDRTCALSWAMAADNSAGERTCTTSRETKISGLKIPRTARTERDSSRQWTG